jgi:hypothetical protein
MAAVQWWVINRQTGGGPRGVLATNYVVVSGVSRPPSTVAGPFATQAQAQAWQSSANTAGNSPGSAIGGVGSSVINSTGVGAIGDLAQRLTQSSTWIRVGEVLAGLILLYVGLKAEFPTTVNTITAPIKETAKGTVSAAKLGLI